MYNAFNSTVIALIPKFNTPSLFVNHQSYSLCNFIYKIISKIIPSRFFPIFSHHISSGDISFLEDRQIHKDVSISQEGLHNIKTMRLKVMILKINVYKAFDRVKWLYITLILTHPCFKNYFIKLTMCCITSTSFVVLINGAASNFFHAERGIRHGCPLSPLLFLQIVEGLRKLVHRSISHRTLKGSHIGNRKTFSHPLFIMMFISFLMDHAVTSIN